MAKKAKTQTWYIKQHSFSRGEEWHRKLKMEFSVDEDFFILAAVMVQAAYFHKKDAESDYKEYQKWKTSNPEFAFPKDEKGWDEMLDGNQEVTFPNFLGEVVTSSVQIKLTKTGAALAGEEWNCGIATTPEEANKLYDLSESNCEGFETEEW